MNAKSPLGKLAYWAGIALLWAVSIGLSVQIALLIAAIPWHFGYTPTW